MVGELRHGLSPRDVTGPHDEPRGARAREDEGALVALDRAPAAALAEDDERPWARQVARAGLGRDVARRSRGRLERDQGRILAEVSPRVDLRFGREEELGLAVLVQIADGRGRPARWCVAAEGQRRPEWLACFAR